MPRLRRADPAKPGISRRRRGRGFEYRDENGELIRDRDTLERLRSLAIPPAWRDVWICAWPMGHIQATGIDAAGRKQYRYHDHWRERRDREKFDSMLRFGHALPRLRRRSGRDLRRADSSREQVLAAAVRLLDLGFFRIGSEGYAEDNETYGLATILKTHVTVGETAITFDYPAKGGKRRVQRIADAQLHGLLTTLRRRRGGGAELLAYKQGGRWCDVRSQDINDYIQAAVAGDFSAKDFRTWNATVLAAVALSVSGAVAADSASARKRASRRAIEEVAGYLGNTPAVCRASYIDPRVFDRFDGGLTIAGALPELATEEDEWPMRQRAVEEAVLDLIEGHTDVDGVERAAALVA